MYRVRHFMKAVTTAGTREQLTTLNFGVPALVLTAEISNTTSVYVGNSLVSSTNYAWELEPGDTVRISAAELGKPDGLIDMTDLWLDVGTSTDGVSAAYLDKK